MALLSFPLRPGVQWQQRWFSSIYSACPQEINQQFMHCQNYSNYEVLTGTTIHSCVKPDCWHHVLNKDEWNTPVAFFHHTAKVKSTVNYVVIYFRLFSFFLYLRCRFTACWDAAKASSQPKDGNEAACWFLVSFNINSVTNAITFISWTSRLFINTAFWDYEPNIYSVFTCFYILLAILAVECKLREWSQLSQDYV